MIDHIRIKMLARKIAPMKSVSAYIERHRIVVPFFEELERKAVFNFVTKDGDMVVAIRNRESLSPAAKFFLKEFATASGTELIQVWSAAGFFANGPKVFRPTITECEALENVEMNFPFSSYRQPFETMGVELPADYYTSRMVPMPNFGTHAPVVAIVRYARDLDCVSRRSCQISQKERSRKSYKAWVGRLARCSSMK